MGIACVHFASINALPLWKNLSLFASSESLCETCLGEEGMPHHFETNLPSFCAPVQS